MLNEHVKFVDFPAQYEQDRDDLLSIVDEVFKSGMLVGGPQVTEFEHSVAKYCDVKYAVGLNSGTDALMFAMEALDIKNGDEVITPPNSFVSSTSAIIRAGGRPVFVDVRNDQNMDPEKIEAAITTNTRAIMPVHLTGRIADMDPILDIAARHGLAVIEDAAQSIGSTYNGRKSGSMGHIGCFSAHPLKNLYAAGDAGFITTNDSEVANKISRLRNIGMADRNTVVEWGTVSRMDTLQAAILIHRLESLDGLISTKRRNVELYRNHLDQEYVYWAPCSKAQFNTFQTFVIQVDRRDKLQAYLKDNGIDSSVHYPVPIHLQPIARQLGYKKGDFPVTEELAGKILSLPIHPSLAKGDIIRTSNAINEFFRL